MAKALLPPATDKLIGPDGQPTFGNFSGAIREVNLDAFDYTRLRRGLFSAIGPLAAKYVKRWNFVGVIDEPFIFGAAVVHLNYIGTGFSYVYDRQAGKIIVEKDIKMPFAANTRFSPSPSDGVSEIRQGTNSILLDNVVHEHGREVAVSFGDQLLAHFHYQEIGPGVTTTTRQMLHGFNSCYKNGGMPAQGKLTVGGREIPVSDKALAILDWSAGTPPHETVWNWSSASGRDAQDRIIAINFGSGLNEYGYTENSVWLDGEARIFPGVSFQYDAKNITGVPWKIFTADGSVDLTFHPDNERHESVNFGLIASSLHQPFGRFTGTILFGKEKLNVELYGFSEEHYAKW